MKKSFSFLLVFFASIGLISCSKDPMIWDYVPIYFTIYVYDDQGRNLLDPDTEDNILEDDLYFIYKGEKYDITYGWPSQAETRALPIVWYGGFIAPAFSPSGPYTENAIFIGEFNRISKHESFELILGNSKNEISYKSKVKSNGMVESSYFLNGHERNNSTFLITLNPGQKE